MAGPLDRARAPFLHVIVVKWITYKGKAILVARFGGLSDTDALRVIDDAQREILKHAAEPRSVLFLSCGATRLNEQLTQRWKAFAAATDATVKATAVEGLPFFVRAVATLMKPNMYFASSERAALDWLAKR